MSTKRTRRLLAMAQAQQSRGQLQHVVQQARDLRRELRAEFKVLEDAARTFTADDLAALEAGAVRLDVDGLTVQAERVRCVLAFLRDVQVPT